jgi:hypothetical protein
MKSNSNIEPLCTVDCDSAPRVAVHEVWFWIEVPYQGISFLSLLWAVRKNGATSVSGFDGVTHWKRFYDDYKINNFGVISIGMC